ncbi:MAG TPA: hypothetical protein VLC94_03450 [Candidatus Acidoferrum sp.]|nr:hypothetical protein [Candidatus Acidoferrum sp.]
MKIAAAGFRVHSGWTSLVTVALEKGRPVVLARLRPRLVATFSYTFRQPYHTAAEMSLDEAAAFLDRQRAEARRLAVAALKSTQSDVAQQGYKLTRGALLLASGRPLPELSKILAAHSLIHAADGEFFREALLYACAKCQLVISTTKERELFAAASAKLRRSSAALTQFLSALGKPLGAPWSQDEKFAALAAWLANLPAR